MNGKIKHNRIKCKKCNDVIESCHEHDFVSCKCGAVSVDGGHNYLRRVGELDNMIELSEYDDDDDDDDERCFVRGYN
jgi:hypothetical protein